MKTLKIIEFGRIHGNSPLTAKEMNTIKGGLCVCDSRFQMGSGVIKIGKCICNANY
ncbi:hypothetical protein [Alkaliflexus imshenetskii]|uniref:hypothetical protein n=1 Tax=Alkaliflexus imshenetskii TaxID=286730 RepID=UPI0012F77AE9|nr:hypothetical protein [Alkaliflexus imshenetskii]